MIRLVTLGFYVEQGGYVNLILDTRPKADTDGDWTLFIDVPNICDFPDWNSAFERICDGKQVAVIKHDGTKVTLTDKYDNEFIQSVFGDMLVDLLTEMRDDGSLQELPLASKAFMVIEEFDGRYFWPDHKTRKTAGRTTM